jgi:hypothetical protein
LSDKSGNGGYLEESVSMVKIGVISDTHLREVSSALMDIYESYFSDVEMIFHAGDLVSLEIAEYLSQKPLHVVQGYRSTRLSFGPYPWVGIPLGDRDKDPLRVCWGTRYNLWAFAQALESY